MPSSDKTSVGWQDYTSAILSGFFGDWLEQRSNPLALSMDVRQDGLVLDPSAPDPDAPKSTLIILAHGLTELETIWDYPGQRNIHYGTGLAALLDATPLRLRYNTGRPISTNGEELAEMLAALVGNWPVPVERLILIGHSMGGLLIRSACYHAEQADHGWLSKVDSCVYVGSPHEGSWLAKVAHQGADMLGKVPRDYIRVIADVLNLRSKGIHNLTEGEILAESGHRPPLSAGARHYAIAGTLGADSGHPITRLFGDALVLEDSARGANQADWSLADYACFPSIHHIRLAHHPAVYRQLREWLA